MKNKTLIGILAVGVLTLILISNTYSVNPPPGPNINVNITSPVPQAQLIANSTTTISWNVTSSQDITNDIYSYTIYWYDGLTKSFASPINVDKSQTSYNWTVPDKVGEGHYLFVCVWTKWGRPCSDGLPFSISIVSSTGPVFPVIGIRTPTNNSAFLPNSSTTISWSVDGNLVNTAKFGIFWFDATKKLFDPPIIVDKNQTSYSWNVPDRSSNDHFLYVCGLKEDNTLDICSYPVGFKILPNPNANRSIFIISPANNANLKVGATTTIRWLLRGSALDIAKYRIYWYDGSTNSFASPIDVNKSQTSYTSYIWTVPNKPANNHFLYVCGLKEDNTPVVCSYFRPFKISGTTLTHNICQNQKCVSVSGSGTDQCQTDNDCAVSQTHKECQNQRCVSVSGSGTNQCQSDSDCATPTVSCSASPNPANVGQNVTWTATSSNFSGTPTYNWSGAVTGTGNPKTASYETTGTKTATVTATYGNQTATSTCSVQVNAATHKECQNQRCVSVSGSGTDQCQTDSDCSSGCKVSSSEVFVGEKITLTAQIEGNYYSLLKWYDITNSQRIGTPPPDAILLGSGASLQVQFDTPGIKKIMLCPVWQQFNCYPSSTCQVVVKPRESASVLCGDNTSRCVFVTSQIYYPTFGGVEGGDKICNDLAKASGLPGTYKAWLSGFDSTHKLAINVSDRLEHSTLPYKLVTGEIVANNWQELTTKPLLHAININEKGQKVTPRWVWTGSMPNGARTPATLGAVSPDCSNWNARYACCASCGWNDSTNNDPRGFDPVTGENIMPQSWGGEMYARLGCNQQYHLYCFQQGSALGSLSAPLSSVQQSITQQLANLYQIVVQLLQQIQALKGQ